MRLVGRLAATFSILFVLGAAERRQWPVRDSEDWADSPEAYFLTSEELAEWKTLESRPQRDAFRERYWLKRDPSPGTERNEFRDTVLARIQTANKRFPIETTPGSRTARGFVFIVFGSPARIFDSHAPPPSRFVPEPLGFPEGNETVSIWRYDRERTSKILDVLNMAYLDIEVIVMPTRRTDAVQNPGLVNRLREQISRKTIVNPDLIPPAPPPVADAAVPEPARPGLDPAMREVLEKAPFIGRSAEAVFGEATLWRETGPAETVVWFFLPPGGNEKRRLSGFVRRQPSGEEVAAFSEPAAAWNAFSPADPGEVIARRLELPPGEYEAAFAIGDAASPRAHASAGAKLVVPDLTPGSRPAVSSLLLTRGRGVRATGEESPFAIGNSVLPPRADGTFSKAEALWFHLEIANPADPSAVSLEVRLRRGIRDAGAEPPFPARLEPIAAGRFVCSHQLNLAALEPGDYRLYVIARGGGIGGSGGMVRAADFRLRD